MEHSCHQCGASVEEGVPFCKQCGAPQIRVARAEAEAGQVASAAEVVAQISVLPQLPISEARVQWGLALPGAALGGGFSMMAVIVLFAFAGPALSAIGSLSPFAIFGPAFMAGGALSVLLYRRRASDKFPSPTIGARIGAASGGFGFLFPAIVAIATLVYRPEELRQPMLDGMAQAGTRGYDPQKLQQMQQMLKTPEGLTLVVVFILCVLLVIFLTGSSIGGALYAAWIRKRSL